MEELNPSNAFGELLLDLIETQYSGDIDAGIEALMSTTGLSEEEVTGIIRGDIVVEEESLLGDIVAAFPDADADDLEVIVSVASDVDQADRDELLASIDQGEGMAEEATEPMEPEDVPMTEDYSKYINQANFMDPRVDQLIQQQAYFAAQEYVKSELTQLDHSASQMVQYGILPPSYKGMLVGNFSDPTQRLAKFSEIASANGVDVQTMLFATKYALGLLENAAEYVEFKDFSTSAEDAAVANFNASLSQVAEADIAAIFEG